ncbi:MAG: hypothetical protein IPK97_15555 [Ahniella sp.]|nr:hypothetical protein [Ahniella sp.]
MVLNFANLITPDEQRVLLDLMARAVAGQSGVLAETGRVVTTALVRQTDFVDAVHPRALAGLRLSRLRPGMPAGVLVDEPLMGDSSLMRNDVAFMLFLNEPDGYEGGELQLDGERQRDTLETARTVAAVLPGWHNATSAPGAAR